MSRQSELIQYTLKHNSWNNPSDKFKIRVMTELLELSRRLDNLEKKEMHREQAKAS